MSTLLELVPVAGLVLNALVVPAVAQVRLNFNHERRQLEQLDTEEQRA